MITPGQPCTGCGTPMVRGPGRGARILPAGMRFHVGHGLCRVCYDVARAVRSAQGRAWPHGSSKASPDWVNIHRALAGEWIRLNVAERRAVVAALTARGESAAGIARRLGIAQRSVVRIRTRERTDAAA